MGFSHSGSSSKSGPSELQKQRVGLQNQLGTGLYNQGAQIFGEYNPTVEGMLNNPVTPGERSAIFESSMAPVASTYDAMRQNLINRAGATRNPAGLIAGEDRAAREKGTALSTAASGAEMNALELGDKRRQAALTALGNAYGINQQAMARLLGGMPGQASQGSSSSFGLKLA